MIKSFCNDGFSWTRIVILLSLLVLLSLQVAASDPEGPVTIAHSLDYRPICYTDSAGQSQGILIDYWRLWSKKTGIQISFVPADWDTCLERVRSGEVDILAGAFYSPERDRDFDFSQTLIEIKAVMFVRSSLSATGLDDLSGHTVAVTRGDRAGEFLNKYHPYLSVREFDSFEGPVRSAAAGEVDALAMDSPSAAYFFQRYKIDDDFRAFKTLYVGRLCAGVAEGRLDLLAIVDDGVGQINDAERHSIIDRWVSTDAVTGWLLLKWLLGSLVAIIVIISLTQMVTLRIRLRRHRLELTAAQEKYRLLFENVPQGIGVSREGRYVFVNPSMSRMSGYTAEELTTRDKVELADPIDYPKVEKLAAMRLRGETLPSSYDLRIRTASNSVLWLQFNTVEIEWEGESALLEFITDITELKTAEAALIKADQQLHAIVDVSPVPLIVTKVVDGTILYANDNLAKLMDYTKEELVGRLSPDFYYDVNERRRVLEILQRDGRIDNYEVRLKKKGGQPLWTIFSLAITSIAGEKVVMGGLYDITARKQMEEALKIERNFVSAVLDTAGALVLVLDPEGRVIRFNAECVRVSGYSSDEVQGKIIWDIVIPPDEVEMLEDRFAYILESHRVIEGENHWQSKDGRRRLFSWSNAVLRDDMGRAEFVVAIGIDITEKREAEEQLRLYREIYLNSKDGIVVIDDQGRFVESNPTHKMLSGKTAEELNGRSFDAVLPIDCAEECHQQIQQTGSYRHQSTFTSADGQERFVDISLFPIKDESDKDCYYVGIGRDISDMKKLVDDLEKTNCNLRDAQIQLIQSEKMASLGMLVAGVAHEINTPLGAINSMHDTLVRSVDKLKGVVTSAGLSDEDTLLKLEKYLSTIDEANRIIATGSERVTNIVRRLRSFARLDEAELLKADIHEGIEDTLTLIHHEIKHSVTVVRDYGDIPRINCYPGQLNQVFLNLLINGKQSISGQGEIKITTRLRDEHIHIAFTDTGHGIPAEQLSKIFDPGFTTKGVGVGTGLGLSICYQIIRDHRGEIEVKSEVGHGTTFTILLPTDLGESAS